jgi:transcriptional regulator with XRE-family HTH domain
MIWNDRLRKLREEHRYTLKEIASKLGVSEAMVSRHESNTKNIPYDIIEQYAKIYGCTPQYIMGWKDDDSSGSDGYYTNPETAKLAQELFDNPDMRVLFDAARDSEPKDLQMAADLLKRLKGLD